ncbi:rhodanese-like domain-containing protein 4A, chloroplastic [Cajanus cajan]|uniref:rhodanese-like domain-containing protein 4A, chloroplastic n=1 Tax=Cajanus cajan TaxID=3821 RepID=UPI00098DA33B|nr:rhodanese-like domain-containing protein 4A, chloroplastic [Cajanus cajan]
MNSLSLLLSPYPLSTKTPKPPTFKPFSHFTNSAIPPSPQPSLSSFQTRSLNPLSKSLFSFATLHLLTPLPCLADVASDAGKISLESVLVSIDNFFNRYPFFVAGCTFIWLVVIPLTEQYFKKCKFVSAIDAFRRLRDDPSSQLLDIRDGKNVRFLRSPNLKLFEKEVAQVEFTEGNEDEFVKKVLGRFSDAPNTAVCVLDSFDGNSMKVAELLFKNGFKEAYAIKGGVRGQQGWMAIQDSFLPPSVHMKKRIKASKQLNTNENGAIQQNDSNNKSSLSRDISPVGNQTTDNGQVKSSAESIPEVKTGSVASLSPYPNYPDLKPPSSPTPSKPQ